MKTIVADAQHHSIHAEAVHAVLGTIFIFTAMNVEMIATLMICMNMMVRNCAKIAC